MEVLASWDDGSNIDLRIAELMNKYDIPTTFYWPANLGGTKGLACTLSEKECKEIASRFPIGAHSVTHQPMNKMSIPQVSMEINDSKKFWEDLLGKAIESFAYPKKSTNSLIKSLVRGAGYKTARTSVPGLLSPGDDLYEIKCTVQIGIDRVEYNDKSWELFSEEMLAKADENSVFHLFGNSLDIEAVNDWENLEVLLKKLTGR